jgi:hypothetical protein
MQMRDECPHVDKGIVDSRSRALDSILKVVSEFLVGVNEMFLDEVKVECDIRRAADPITPHPYCACV